MRIKNKIIMIIFTITLAFSITLSADTKEDFESVSQELLNLKKVCLTKRVNVDQISLDGKIEDEGWKTVAWNGDFIQRTPYEGKKSTFDTKFKITYDKNNLYIAIRAFDNDPLKIVKRVSRRDEIDGDWIMVDIDSYNDKKTSFYFAVNAAGVRRDGIITDDGENTNESWDPIWEAKTSIDKQGWVAELKVPFDQLRFSNSKNHKWGIQVTRKLFRKEETSNWQFIPRNSSGWVHYFGQLEGLKDIQSGGKLQLLPYTVGKIRRYEADLSNPYNLKGRNDDLNFGLDGKYALTSNLTLDFTINPDFGQVEADPSEINLTAFESYFREKRPFFIEGKNILSFSLMIGDGDNSNDSLFYSRRIGQRPHYNPDADYVDMPVNTTILGAMKLTGKTKSGLSIGIMESVTSAENANYSLDGNLSNTTVEPMTNYFMLRAQQDLNNGNTTFGGALTAVNRGFDEDHLDFLHRSAYTGGIDFLHKWKNKTYNFSAKLIFSSVQGSEEAISETQQSPIRYYQRPDANHLSLDESRTSLQGFGGTFWFGKFGGGNLSYSTGFTFKSPGLELNDMGYMNGADRIMQWFWAGYNINEPFLMFRNIRFNFNQWLGWNFAGESRFNGGNFGLGGQFKNYWNFWASINLNGRNISDSLLRGGPSFYTPGGQGLNFSLSTDPRKKIRLHASYNNFFRGEDILSSESYGFGITYKPTNALSITINPSINFRKSANQYIDTLDYADELRYILASIDQKTYRLTIRLDYSITPKLSIQFYAQPFVSTGSYKDFKRVVDPRSDIYSNQISLFSGQGIQLDTNENTYNFDENGDNTTDYSAENPNFNFLQFASNLVVRWAYAPGSTVFLVWSQGRTSYESDADYNYGRNMNNLFNLVPDNVFLIKFTYNFR